MCNIINESQRDIIVCSTISVVVVILQYILSSILFSQNARLSYSGHTDAQLNAQIIN